MNDARALGLRAHEMLDALGRCTDDPERITRPYLGPAHREAVALVHGWMRDAGLYPETGAIATVHGRTSSATDASRRRLLIGSHIDTVPDGGRFDGMLGVVVGILAAAELQRRGVALAFDLEVLAFGDEEGLRFPGASIGSLALAEPLPQTLLDSRDDTGTTLREALVDFGITDEPQLSELSFDPAGLVGYLEVHIEQGPVLEALDAPLGVVTSIAAALRARITVSGRGGHAGTVPMTMRHDAMTAAAQMILAVEQTARTGGDDVRGTAGELTVDAAAANAIPAEVRFSIDLRAPSDAQLADARGELFDSLQRIAADRDVQVRIEIEYEGAATMCDPRLSSAFASALDSLTVTGPTLPSGAGHDAQSLALITPVAMLFVRSRDGVSHVPEEFSSPDDVGLAVLALTEAISILSSQHTE